MKILVIGGTQFVGKHFVLEAVARGHELTLFNRGNKPTPEGVAHVVKGDRNSDLARLEGGSWDAVLDTSAYFPRQVRDLASALADRVRHYALVSTISVYADQTQAGIDEDAELSELADPATEELTNETYGGLKVLCERALAEGFAGEKLVVRPGLVVGPDDPTDRFTYWPARVARGGSVLAPVGPGMPVQWIDVRDLAAWLVDALERRVTGTFNAVSEAERFTLGDVLDASLTARRAGPRPPGSEEEAEIVWVSEEFLLENEVGAFVELPLWIPGEHLNFSRVDGSRAYREGLRVRPVDDTVTATLEWYLARPERPMRAGLSPEREQELLAAWRERRGTVGAEE